MTKKLYIQTFGCQMNEHDSGKMTGLLAPRGFEPVETPQEADVVLMNTCTVREKAVHKAVSMLGRWKWLKNKRPGVVIGVTGCMAELKGSELLARYPYVDLVMGPDQIPRLPRLLEQVMVDRERVTATGFADPGTYDFPGHLDTPETPGVSAYVTIQKGCNKHCTFCIVPTVRGTEESRAVDEVLAESRVLAERGVREIVLIGQTVNSYGRDLKPRVLFPELVQRVAEIEGVERIRFTSPHPQDLVPELAEVYRSEAKLASHMHLPVQSGSDRILKAMRRTYSVESYYRKVAMLREARPDIALTTDIIVGFPGETREDFEATMKLVRDIHFDSVFAFPYSPRPGTAAAELEDDVPKETKSEHLQELFAEQAHITAKRYATYVGRIEQVLVEGPSKAHEEELTGRTSHNVIVNFAGPRRLVGRMVELRLAAALPHSLRGETLGSAALALA